MRILIVEEFNIMEQLEEDLRKILPLVPMGELDRVLFTEYCLFLTELRPSGHEEWQDAFRAFWGLAVKILGEIHGGYHAPFKKDS